MRDLRVNPKDLDPEKIKRFYWEKNYSIEDVARNLGVSYWKLYSFMNKCNIVRRDHSQASFLSSLDKPQFRMKPSLTIEEEKLKVAGIMLYWAEGTLRGQSVDFANSNPEMIKIFLKFLREICGVSEDRLRVYLYAYSQHNLEQLKAYWQTITRIPLEQFTKPYVRHGNLNLSNHKLPYGLVHIRYNDKRLLVLLTKWIGEYVNWVGGGVANRTRL